MSELVNKTTENIKDKLYDCLQSTFEEIEAVKHHLSCIYEGIANDLDILESNRSNEHYSETEELDGFGYGCTNKTCVERIRNKAIDDYVKALKPILDEKIKGWINSDDLRRWCENSIDKVAEQLKTSKV